MHTCHLSWDADIFILAWIGFYNELKMGTDSLALPSIDYPALESEMLLMTCLTNKVVVLVAQSYPTLCDPMDCGLPGSSAHGIFQARILEWIAIPFSRGSSQPRDGTQISCITGRFFTIGATRDHTCIKTMLIITIALKYLLSLWREETLILSCTKLVSGFVGHHLAE